MNSVLRYIMVSGFVLTTFFVQAQIQRNPVERVDKKYKQTEEATSKLEEFSADIKIGNLGFFGNLFLSAKANAGYNILPWLNGGIGFKVFYSQIFIPNAPDDNYTDLGGFAYARAKVFKNIFLQAEYHYTSFDFVNSLYPGANLSYPTIGAGYVSGNGPWKFGLELNFLVSELARDYQGSVLEYWTGAFYHF